MTEFNDFRNIEDMLYSLAKDAEDYIAPYIVGTKQYFDEDEALTALLASPIIAPYEHLDLVKGIRAALDEDPGAMINSDIMEAFIELHTGYSADGMRFAGIFDDRANWAEETFTSIYGKAPYEDIPIDWEAVSGTALIDYQILELSSGKIAVFRE